MLQCVDGFANEFNFATLLLISLHVVINARIGIYDFYFKSTTRLSLDRTKTDTYETAQ